MVTRYRRRRGFWTGDYDAITAAEIVVFILSDAAIASPHIRSDIDIALHTGSAIILFCIEDIRATNILSYIERAANLFTFNFLQIDAFGLPEDSFHILQYEVFRILAE